MIGRAVQRQPFASRCAAATCRVCGHAPLEGVLDLGDMPLTAGFRDESDLCRTERKYPLEVAFCESCALVQILQTVPAQEMFNDEYPYYSSYSDALLRHSREHVEQLIESRRLNGSSLVVELASNDGYLLRNCVDRGIRCLGVEPCSGPARIAQAIGVPTIVEFFGETLAQRLVDAGTQADAILANNVLAHVTDQNDFVRGIALLLKDDGVAEIEFPYVRRLIDHIEFDTIYHEHMCYFSLHAVDALFRRHGLFINDVHELSIHGGSLRIAAARSELPSAAVLNMLRDEKAIGMDRHTYYAEFGRRVDAFRDEFRSMLLNLVSQGKRLAAYGAAAKGVILLNSIVIDGSMIEFVCDRNVHKHGKWLPGIDVPVVAAEQLVERMPDFTIILPWNFKDEIIAQQQEYHRRGGRFIVPIPRPVIV